LATCSYGIDYIHFDSELLVFGILVDGHSALSTAQKKQRQLNPDKVVGSAELTRAVDCYRGAQKEMGIDLAARKAAIIANYQKSMQYTQEFLDSLQPSIQKSFSVLHDYRQFIGRVRQNINVLIETRYGGRDFDEKLGKSHPSEGAIYWASILMEEKLKTASMLVNPEQITSSGESKVFRLHGAVLKYVRIYNAAFVEKNVTLRVIGESVGMVRGHPQALPVIPHTLIDNALKYSLSGSDVREVFRESEYDIELKVISFGPRIEQDELTSIFEIFYRGRNATLQDEDGSGFGLYLAQFIAQQTGTSITVHQSPDQTRYGHQTTFSVCFRRES